MKNLILNHKLEGESISNFLIESGHMDMCHSVNAFLTEKSKSILESNSELFYSLWPNYDRLGRTLTKFRPFLNEIIGDASKDFSTKDLPFLKTDLKCEKCDGAVVGKPGERRTIKSYSDTRAALICLDCSHHQSILKNTECKCSDCSSLRMNEKSILIKNMKEAFESDEVIGYGDLSLKSKVILHAMISSMSTYEDNENGCVLSRLKENHTFPTSNLARLLIFELYNQQIIFPDVEITLSESNGNSYIFNPPKNTFDIFKVFLRINISEKNNLMNSRDLLCRLSNDLNGKAEDDGVRDLCDSVYISLAHKYLENAIQYIYSSYVENIMLLEYLHVLEEALDRFSLCQIYSLIDLNIILLRDDYVLIENTHIDHKERMKLIDNFMDKLKNMLNNSSINYLHSASSLSLVDDNQIDDYYGNELDSIKVTEIEISAFQKACKMKYFQWVKI